MSNSANAPQYAVPWLPSENPNAHLTSFIEVYDTVKYNGVTEEALRLCLFPLLLSDRALVD